MFAYLAWARRAGQAALFAGLAMQGAGCGLNAEPDAAPGGGGSSGSAGGGGGASTTAPTLTLQIPNSDGVLYTPRRDETVVRSQREQTAVSVLASEAFSTVRFALLPNDESMASGDNMPGDAALDESEIVTDENGTGTVTLTAPSRPTTFLLRASIATLVSEQVRFSVEGTSRASLEVVPLYNGRRMPERWTAKANRYRTCADLAQDPPDDRDYEDSSTTGSVLLEGVPAGEPLAVTVRAEHYAWGCTDIASAIESSVPQRVEVIATDVQIRLEESSVELELGLDSVEGWADLLRVPLPEVAAALRGDSADDVEALLDAMGDALDEPERTLFRSKRGAERWDQRLRDALGAGSDTALTTPFARWLAEGLDGLESERALRGTLAASSAAVGAAELTLESVFGHEPKTAGFASVNRGSWEVTADVVLVGMTLDFRPARFLVASARAPAQDEHDGAGSIGEAFAELLPCDAVAAALEESPDCAGDCASLCQEGLELLVSRAADAPLELAQLVIAASGDASVGPNAEIEALDGSWIGRLEYDDQTVELRGDASAQSD